MDTEFEWLEDFTEQIFRFIQDMNVKKNFTYFKYSYSGDLFDKNTNWGLGQLVFATKILYMIDKIDSIDPIHKSNLINSINSFQDKDGYYSDKNLFSQNKKGLINFLKRQKTSLFTEKRRRAETRQSFAALLALNSKPCYPFLNIPYSIDGINCYLNELDWTQPWDAGSHFSYLIFFLNLNKKMFGIHDGDTDDLIEYAINWINDLQSPLDGSWYKKRGPNFQKVNGAMKILTGLSAAEKLSFSYPEKLIDTCLTTLNDEGACNNFNIIYVLYCCNKITNYRSDEIKDFCFERLKMYKQYYFPDIGGFSFYKGKSNDVYYGSRVTNGFNEPDIHGTVMYLWGITLISKILKLDLGLKEPIT